MTHALPEPDFPPSVQPPRDYLLPDKVYVVGRAFVGLILPAISALIFALGGIWNYDHVTEIIGTIAALTVFLGAVLAFGRTSYDRSDAKYDGVINLSESPEGKKTYSLDLTSLTPEEIVDKTNVNFKVAS